MNQFSFSAMEKIISSLKYKSTRSCPSNYIWKITKILYITDSVLYLNVLLCCSFNRHILLLCLSCKRKNGPDQHWFQLYRHFVSGCVQQIKSTNLSVGVSVLIVTDIQVWSCPFLLYEQTTPQRVSINDNEVKCFMVQTVVNYIKI